MEYVPVTNPDPLGAEFCENFLPTTRGLKVRGGISRAAYVTDAVTALLPFVEATSQFFAATASAVYDISSLNPTTAPVPALSGMSGGDWSFQQVGVAGGNRLLIANGEDLMQIYNGGTWTPLTDEAVNELSFDALTADFAIGETLTGGTSGAAAEILGLTGSGATGSVYLGAVTGTFQDNEAITSTSGAATSDGTVSVASSLTLTGVDTDKISQLWLYRSRVFMVEKDTLRAWYLPTGQVGGAALDLSLGGIFRRGGSLVFGATWSLDAGDGQDDKCVFVSSEGEVAVYEGSDPSDATNWNLIGRYDIPEPVGKHASINAGGDLAIATRDGIVPLSEAINKDPAVLGLSAVSRPIERTWEIEARQDDIRLHKWTAEDVALVVLPASDLMLTANLETGAWGTQTGWACDCAGEYNSSFYIGRADGRIYKINDTGADDGQPFVARLCWAFSGLGDPTLYKQADLARMSFFGTSSFQYSIGIATDYRVSFGTPPNAAPDPNTAMVWGSFNWGDGTWGGPSTDPGFGQVGLYKSVFGTGYAVAPTVQITSGNTEALDVEVLSVDILAQVGGRAA